MRPWRSERRLPARPLGRPGRRTVSERIHGGTIAGAGPPVAQIAGAGLQHRPGIFWVLLHSDRLPRFQIALPASDSGGSDGVCRFGLADLSITAARKPSVALHSGPRHSRGRIANAMAPRNRRKRSTMEGAGRRSGGMAISVRRVVAGLSEPARPRLEQ